MRIPTTLSTFPARRWWALPLGVAALFALFCIFHFGKAFAAAQPAALLPSPAVSDSVTNPVEWSMAHAMAQAQGSDLTINTYLASGVVSPGYELTYGLTFANGGPDPAEDVIITATLPLSTTYLTYSGAYSPTVNGRQLIWSIGALPAHSSNNVNYTIHLDEATPVDSVLTNTVRIATTSTDPDLINNSATLTNTVTSSTPDLSLSTNWAGSVARDSEVTYYLYYQNNSYGQLALATVISNTLPEGVTFRRARWLPQYDESRATALTPTSDGNSLHFALGVIPGLYQGAYYGWLEVVAYVAADVPADTTLTNRATILTASNDPNLANNTTERSGVVVEPTRDLHLGQSYSGGTLLPGDTVTFYLSYVNYGNAHLPDTVITDTLPAGLTFVSASDEYPFTVTDNTIVWQIGAVAGYGAPGYAGNFSLTAQVAAETPPGTVLRNRIVGATSAVETGDNNNSAEVALTVQPPTHNLGVDTYHQAGEAVAGQELTYWVRVYNYGNRPLTNVRITDTLPISATYVRWSGNDFLELASTADGQVIWRADTLPASTNTYLYLTVRLTDTLPGNRPLTNRVVGSAAEPEATYADNEAAYTLTSLTTGHDLTLSKGWSGGSPLQSSSLNYTLQYANRSNQIANSVTITDTLPANTTFGYAATNGWNYTLQGRNVVWTRETVGPGEEGSLDLAVVVESDVPPGTPLVNQAVISSSDDDENPADNRATHTLVVSAQSRDLYTAIGLNRGSPVAGQELTYSLYYRNYGEGAAQNVVLTSTLPVGLAYVRAEGAVPPTLNGDQLVWQLGTVPGYPHSGFEGAILLTVRIDPSVATGVQLETKAAISTSDQETGFAANQNSTTVTVEPTTRDLQVYKSIYAGSAIPGNQITYQIYYYNTGNSPSNAVVVTDTLPAGTTYLSANGPITPTILGRRVIWPLGTVAAGASGNLRVTIQVGEAVAPGATLANTVVIGGSETDVDPANNRYVDRQTVTAATPDLSLNSWLVGSLARDAEVTYRLYYYNTTYNQPAVQTVITNTLPTGVTFRHALWWPQDDPQRAIPITPTINGDTLIFNLGTIFGAYNSSHYFGSLYVSGYVPANLAEGTQLTNRAGITTPNDTNALNNYSERTDSIILPTRDLYVATGLQDGVPVPGQQYRYWVNLANYGNAAIDSVVLTETLPAGATFVSATDNYGRAVTPTAIGATSQGRQRLRWELGAVAGNGGLDWQRYYYVTVVLAANATPGNALLHEVEAWGTQAELPNNYQNYHSDVRNVQAAQVDLSLQHYTYEYQNVVPGATVWFYLAAYNSGNVAAQNVVITQTLPSGLRFAYTSSLENSWQVTTSGNQVIYRRSNFAAGASSGWYVYVTVADSVIGGESLSSQVTIGATNPETDDTNNQVTATLTADAVQRDLRLTKGIYTVHDGYQPGTLVAWRLNYYNAGNVNETAVVITDTLPLSVTYNNAYYYYDTCCWERTVSGRTVTWRNATLPAGSSGALYVAGIIRSNVAPTTVLTNVATLRSATYNGGVVTATHPITVQGPTIRVTPDVLDLGVNYINQVTTHTLSVSNVGPGVLAISDIAVDSPLLTLSDQSFTIPAGQTRDLRVRLTATESKAITGTLVFTSNDYAHPVLTVPIAGVILPPPTINVAPSQIEAVVHAGERQTATLTISNTGASDLHFTLSAIAADPTTPLKDFLIIDHGKNKSFFAGYETQTISEGALPGLTLADLQRYRAVYFEPDWSNYNNLRASMATLSAYVERGGVAVINIAGNVGSGVDIDPAGTDYARDATHNAETIQLPNHPYITGEGYNGAILTTADFNSWGWTDHGYLQNYPANSTVVLTNAQDASWLHYKWGSGHVVLTTLTYGWGCCGGQGTPLANLINYVQHMQPPWFTASPTVGIVAAGQSLPISVTLDATQLVTGVYTATLPILSNDPATPLVSIPITLHVTGDPLVRVEPIQLDFGTAFVGYPTTRTLTIYNDGTGPLNIASITGTQPTLSVQSPSLTVPIGEARQVTVTYQPTALETLSATLLISTNAPITPLVMVPVIGSAIAPPVIAVAPAAFTETLASGAALQTLLTISDTGDTPLQWTVEAVEQNGLVGLQGDYYDGYHGDDLSFFDQNTPLLRRLDATVDFSDYTDPAWNLGGTPALADLETFSVRWRGKLRIPTSGLYTFYLVSDDGGYLFLDQAVAAPTSANATINYGGLHGAGEVQNSVYLTAGLHDLLLLYGENYSYSRVQLAWSSQDAGIAKQIVPTTALTTAPRWLTFTPTTGTTAAQGATQIGVTLDASDLISATYHSTITVISNDPAQRRLSVPVTLHVTGQPQALLPALIDFGNVYAGYPHQQSLVVQNAGAAPLVVHQITPDHAGVSVTPTTFTVPPFSLQPVTVTLATTQTGALQATLAVSSSDPISPLFTVVVNANVLAVPDIRVTPSGFNVSQDTGLVTTRTLLIQNVGTGLLHFDLNVPNGLVTVAPPTGTLAAGESAPITVTFDTTTRPNGFYSGQINVNSDDPDTSQVQVPVSLIAILAPPETPVAPNPQDGELNVRIDQALTWQRLPHASAYDLYLWEDGQAKPGSPTAASIGNYYDPPGNLKTNTLYHWQVVARNVIGSAPGAEWRFTTEALPDLTVTAVNAPPTAFSGQPVELSWVVQNLGQRGTTASTWYDLVYIAQNPTFDAQTATFLGYVANPAYLGPNESYLKTATFNLPQGISGNYYAFVLADGYNYMREQDKNNNQARSLATFQVSLTPPPDLQVSSVRGPLNAFSGDAATISWVVRNAGDGDTRVNGWYDRIYLADSTTLNVNTAYDLGSVFHSGLLGANEAYTGTASLQLPQKIFGSYYLFVVTDINNNVYENVWESNNTSAASPAINITLSPPPDLEVSTLTVPATAASAGTLRVDWTVSNYGAGAPFEGFWEDQVYLTTSPTFTTTGALVLGTFTHSGLLAAGDAYARTADFVLPVNISGTYYVHVWTDYNNRVFEFTADDNNVTTSDPVAITLRPPDLVVATATVPANAGSGQPINVSWTVRNQGSGQTFESQWTDHFYLSTDPVLNPANATLLGQFIRSGRLAANESYSRTQTLLLPNGIAGQYYLHIWTDVGNQVFEHTADSNNVSTRPINVTLTPSPDLRVTSVAPALTGAIGTPFRIGWSVTNSGAAATASWQDRLYLSTDNVFSPLTDRSLGAYTRPNALASGQSYTQSRTIVLSDTLAPGTYTLFVVADDGNVIYEHNAENNNVGQRSNIVLTARPRTDLVLSALHAPTAGNSGQPITLTWNVSNTGAIATLASSWLDAAYLSADTTFSPNNDHLVGSWLHVGALAANGHYSRTTTATLPHGLSGAYYLFLVTDSQNGVDDALRANNVLSVTTPLTITLSPTPDLQAVLVNPPSSGLAGQPLDVTWRGQNNGATAANGLWYDAIYFSYNATVDASDTQLTSVAHSGPLAPGEIYTQTATVAIPGNATGQYYLLLRTDNRNDLYEQGGEQNNLSAHPITINVPPPADLTPISVTVPVAAAPGEPVTIQWQLDNVGAFAATGYECDAVFISADTSWDIGDALLGESCQYIDLPAGGARGMQLQAKMPDRATLNALTAAAQSTGVTGNLPGVTPGQYYAIVRADIRNNIPESNETNNSSASSNTLLVDVETLMLGVPVTATLRTGESLFYRVNVTATETLLLTLDSASTVAANELYLRYNETPTRGNFDYSYSTPLQADQEVLVPSTEGGNYYALLYGGDVPEGTQSLAILAQTLNFSVRSVNATEGGNVGSVTVQIRGAKFTEDMTVALENPQTGARVTASRVVYIDTSSIFATFDLVGATPGLYDVVAKQPNGALARLADGFTVVQGGASNLITNIQYPANIRPGMLAAMTIQFANDGNVDLPTPLYLLASQGGAPIGVTSADLSNANTSLHLLFQEAGGPTDLLRPGAYGSITVYTKATAPLQFALFDLTNDDTPIPWDTMRPAYALPSVQDPVYFEQYWTYLRAQMGETNRELRDNILARQQALRELGYENVTLDDVYDLINLEAAYYAANPDDSLNASDLSAAKGAKDGQRVALNDPVKTHFNTWGNGKIDNNVPYNPNQPTHVIVHGFKNTGGNPDNENKPTQWMADMAQAIRDREPNANIIVTDWQAGADRLAINYRLAAGDVYNVGEQLARHLVDIGANPDTTHLIGHSLGAQVAGQAGEWYNILTGERLDRITGLDPAGPLFQGEAPTFRLDPTDAKFVDVYHTSDTFGDFNEVGTVDFYPNRGDWQQPGQWTALGNHGYAYELFTDSIHGRYFIAPDGTILGYDVPRDARGSHDVNTNGTPYENPPGSRFPFTPIILIPLDPNNPDGDWIIIIIVAVDPNDILGPIGYGDANWVPAANSMGYTIRYENDPELATAPAQLVTIEQTLDSDLDPRTFRLGSFGFGDFLFTVPDNRAFYQTRVGPLEIMSRTLYVDVNAGIDVTSGKAFWILQTIDPATGAPPTDALAGFLPPDINEGEGQGFVTYSVKPKTRSQTGAVVDAEARIVFDTNDPIDTPPIFHTLDAVKPTSQLDVLPAVSNSSELVLTWQNSDDSAGSGVGSVAIYVAVDDGPFTLWQDGITSAGAVFNGEPGRRYAFFALTKDNAGNQEALKSSAEAATYVYIPGLPTAITVTATPSHLVADGASTSVISATVIDAGAVPVTNRVVTFTTSLGNLALLTATTDLNGTALTTVTAPTQPGVAQIVAATGSISATTAVTITTGAPVTLTVQARPTTLVADGLARSVITATVTDAFGNLVAGEPLTFTTALGNLALLTATTDLQGAVVNTFTAGTQTGVATVVVNTRALSQTKQITLTAGAPVTVTVAANPASLTADGASASVIRASVVDRFANPLAGQVVTFTTSLGTVAPLTRTTNSQGVVTTTLTAATTSGVATVQAQADTVTSATVVTLTAGAPTTLTLTAQPPTLVADGTSVSTLTAGLVDAFGNPTPGQTIRFATALGQVTPVTATTTASGVVTATLISTTTTGTATVTATGGGLTQTTTIALVAGAPVTVTVTASPVSLTADGVSTSVISATVLDRFANPIPNQVVSFTTALGSVTPLTQTTNSQGVVTTTLTAATTTGFAQILAQAGAAQGSTTVALTAGAPVTLTVTAQPAVLVANGVSTSTVTARLVDAFGNPTSGQRIRFATTLGQVTPMTATTTTSGIVTATLRSATTTGAAIVTVNSDTLTETTTITLVASAPFTMTLAAQPTTLTADGVSTSTLTVQLTDPQGNPTPNQVVSFTTTLGAITPMTATTNANGVATTTFSAGDTVGAAQITATAGPLQATTVLNLLDRPITGLTAGSSSPTTLQAATLFTATIAAGSNVSYTWTFGDGATGSGAKASHTYSAVGLYTATVTAMNARNVQTATTQVQVLDQPITSLTAINSGPTLLGTATNFTATVGAGSNVSYTWSFGDGLVGAGPFPMHTYSAAGHYTATVTATNARTVMSATTRVQVIEPPAQITIVLDARPQLTTNFGFTGNLGRFVLDDGERDDGDSYTNSRAFTVPAGTYSVRRNSALNWFVTGIQCTPEANAAINLANREATVTVRAGDNVACTFVVERGVIIRARVFNDLVRRNAHYGRRNAGDPWLANWEVKVLTAPGAIVANGVTTPTVGTTLTEAIFRYLPAGTYTVCETLQLGWTNSTPGASDLVYGQPCKTVTLLPGQNAVVLFGNFVSTVVASEATPMDEIITDDDQVADLPFDPAEEETLEDEENDNLPRIFLPFIVR